MSTFLAISSQVARGHIGLGALQPALHALGHEVIALPTVILSNHPGHGEVSGQRIDPALLHNMLATLDRHGWLMRVDAVLSGYLPTPGHVEVVIEALRRVRAHSNAALYFCDPVIGDDPKGLYIAEDAARALTTHLVPRADFTFPNRFELEWLSGQTVSDVARARAAARAIGAACTVATSIPHDHGALATLAIGADEAWISTVRWQENVPSGTGDVFAGLFAGYLIGGRTIPATLGSAVGAVEQVIAASVGRDELQLVEHLGRLATVQPRPPGVL
jgi:pyridoxine kinase